MVGLPLCRGRCRTNSLERLSRPQLFGPSWRRQVATVVIIVITTPLSPPVTLGLSESCLSEASLFLTRRVLGCFGPLTLDVLRYCVMNVDEFFIYFLFLRRQGDSCS